MHNFRIFCKDDCKEMWGVEAFVFNECIRDKA